MSAIQKFFKAILPKKWAHSMEEESRRWMLGCSCGHERSVWEAGGIRWKAAGNARWYGECPACHRRCWQRVYKRGKPG